MWRELVHLAEDERATAAIEYALVASLVSVALTAALLTLGVTMRGEVEAIIGAIDRAGR